MKKLQAFRQELLYAGKKGTGGVGATACQSGEANRLLQGLQCQPQVCREANRLLQGLQCQPQVCKDPNGFFKDLY